MSPMPNPENAEKLLKNLQRKNLIKGRKLCVQLTESDSAKEEPSSPKNSTFCRLS